MRSIPHGRVSTYGLVAQALGNPRLSRVVGYAMGPAPADVPCHRVVKKDGVLSDAFEPMGQATHRMLLEMEGVCFRADGTVDMEKHLFIPPPSPDTAPDRTA